MDLLRRVDQRADSLLAEADDREIATGRELLRQWAAQAPCEPVIFRPDLLVLEHQPELARARDGPALLSSEKG
jgi:hypothetical protein